MDICLDNEAIIRKCYKCEDSVLCNLNVDYNASYSTVTLWNKFQIYVYEDLELKFVSKVIVPEFQIQSLITSSNYLICVDYGGNIHTTSLKFKNVATQKRFKGSFQQRESDIIALSLFNEDHTICLKFESNTYFLNIHKINSEFKLQKSAIIICKDLLPLQKNKTKYILKSFTLYDRHIENVKRKLNASELHIQKDYRLVVISLDGLNVYACLYSTQYIGEEITIVKLYTCPSQISHIDVIDIDNINIIIGLQTGTIISLNFKDNIPKVVHLNTAIHKILAFKDNVIYTDGLSMWRAENILSQNITFRQIFVKNVIDFIKFGDQIISVTFNNLIYTFSLEDQGIYIKPESETKYCPVEKLFQDANYLNNILKHVKQNDALLKMQKQERDHIMALTISSRQDVMDEVITPKIIVYESYEDAMAANNDVILTNSIYEYFNKDSFYFLINIVALKEHRGGDILTKDVGDIRVHITFNSESKMIKTNTINIIDQLDNITFLIPLENKFIKTSEMRVDIKIVTNIPGIYDKKHKIWPVLYRKSIVLNSEHFIKFNINADKNLNLKESKLSLEELILETAKHQYGHILEITNVRQSPKSRIWQMYVRLPTGYQHVLKNDAIKKKFTSKKVTYFFQQFSAEDFLQSKSNIYLTIWNEKVKIEVDNDGFTNPSLKVSSCDPKIVFDMRNFLSNLIYSVVTDFGPGKEFISHSFYITVESLKNTLEEYMATGSDEELSHLIDLFERKIVGALPI